MLGFWEATLKPPDGGKLGSLLAEVGREASLKDEEFTAFESSL